MIPNPILKVLSSIRAHRVRALLMGGQACVFYGAAEFSRDTDLAILADAANLVRLRRALDDLQAEVIAVPPIQLKYLRGGHAINQPQAFIVVSSERKRKRRSSPKRRPPPPLSICLRLRSVSPRPDELREHLTRSAAQPGQIDPGRRFPPGIVSTVPFLCDRASIQDATHRFFPATQIDVVWFPEGAGGDRFEEKIFQGPLARITRDAIDYIERHYLKETVIKHADRPEAERFWNFPRAAIEEAVVNAVYHRSYEVREPVEVRITPDELVVLSFPGPDRSIRMEDLQAGRAVSRRYRNRRIGEFLKELDLTEGCSTGIPKILKVMAQNGSAPPRFESDGDRTHFLIRLPVRTGTAVDGPSLAPSGVQSGVQSGQVLGLLRRAPRSMSEVAGALGLKTRTGSLQRTVRNLLEQGIIEYTLPDTPNSRLQKYRLTTEGRAILDREAERGGDT